MSDCYQNWNDQTRLRYDSCARHAYDQQSKGSGRYNTGAPGWRWCETGTEYSRNMCEPFHYQKVYRNGCKVDNESELMHAPLSDPRLINQLYARPYRGSYMGAGQASATNKNTESELFHGVDTRGGPRKACDVLSGVSIDRFECLPEYGNPQRVQHVVEPWIRGGDNTRDHVRRVNYERRLKNSRNNKEINLKDKALAQEQ
jgi:hypothetical protein